MRTFVSITLALFISIFTVTSTQRLNAQQNHVQPNSTQPNPPVVSQSEGTSEDALEWRTTGQGSSGSNPQVANQNSFPNYARPFPAGQIPVRSAGYQVGPANYYPAQQIPTQLIPTQPTRPLAQLIPNATMPAPVIPAGQGSEPQLFADQPNQASLISTSDSAPETSVLNLDMQFDELSSNIDESNSNVQLVSAEEQAGSSTQQEPATDNEITRIKKGIESLPNTAGQVWREYDITPYTFNVTNSARPQQALIDWILKETGEELWFNEPLGILSASKNELRVYHTPQIQQQVKSIVDRFVYGKGRTEVMGMRLVTINNPSWRTLAYSKMQPIPVSAAGVEGWLMSKENAAILINELSRRSDFQQHSGGDVVMHDGQKYTLSSKRPIQFNQSLRWVNAGGVVYAEPVASQFDEGFSLDISSLSSIDQRSCEAIIKCEIDQIERLQKVSVNVPTSTGQTQALDLQIPQMVSWRVHERFRWPSDQVLLLSCGVVATPGPKTNGLFDLNSLLNGSRRRADALMFIEYKGPANATRGAPTATLPILGR